MTLVTVCNKATKSGQSWGLARVLLVSDTVRAFPLDRPCSSCSSTSCSVDSPKPRRCKGCQVAFWTFFLGDWPTAVEVSWSEGPEGDLASFAASELGLSSEQLVLKQKLWSNSLESEWPCKVLKSFIGTTVNRSRCYIPNRKGVDLLQTRARGHCVEPLKFRFFMACAQLVEGSVLCCTA